MKYVYVLTSSEKDYYYEQFFLSLSSMRLYNPDAEVVVLIDEKTKQGLTDKRSGYAQYVSETKIIGVPDEYPQKQASRWIKTSINNFVSGDFLFIDCDTIITGKLTPVFSPDINIGCVLDTHVTLENHHLRDYFKAEVEKAGFPLPFTKNTYFNSGIIFYRDNSRSREFFEKWHNLWIESNKKGVSVDQPSFNQADCDLHNIITELSGVWNCQISHNGLNFLHDAKIIHYYATSLLLLASPYKLASSEVLLSIKETGEISAEITKLLHSPLAAFEDNTRIVSGKYVLDVFDSPMFKLLVWLRDCHNGFYKTLNGIIRFFVNILKKNPRYNKRKLRNRK
jgi:Lipopolysaccharide biosynthesis proteins, LPS:glycosyltransferases